MMRILCLLAGLGIAATAFGADEFHWWEAEAATQTTMSTDASVPKDEALAKGLSGGQWLRGKVAPGLFAEYAVTIEHGGEFQFYVRRFWAHGAFRWRFDAQEWEDPSDRQDIVDSVPVAIGPLSWIALGPVTLTAGPHVLRVELVADSSYKFNSLYSFDCFVLSAGPWAPKGLDHAGGPVKPTITIPEADFGKHLPRTMALLSSATPEHRTPIYILCYGQSIIASGWVDQAVRKWAKEQYPNAIVRIENRAIGGYQAPILRRTSWQDLYPAYPDLVLFHDYGGQTGEWEEMLRNVRRYTTAEFYTWTDHVDNFSTSIDHERDADAELHKQLAAKYDAEIADVRPAWKAYLHSQHLKPQQLLVDQIHLNPAGGKLLGDLLLAHFRVHPAADTGWTKQVQTLALAPPAPGVTTDAAGWSTSGGGVVGTSAKPLRLAFTGNRVDVIAMPCTGAPGSARLLLDGQPPSASAGVYAASRSTLAPGSWWPAITRVQLGAHPVAEEITMAFHDVAPDGSAYTCDVSGAVSGPLGSFQAGAAFTATGDRFTIAAEDFALANVHTTMKKDLPATFTITWKVYSMSRDTWRAPAVLRPELVPQETLIQCWDSQPHILEIIPDGNGPVAIKHLVTYTPPGAPAEKAATDAQDAPK